MALNIRLACLAGLISGSPIHAAEPKPLTLADCYALALQRSEAIAIHQERIAESEAHFSQSLSGILPKASFVSTDKRQDDAGGDSVSSRFALTRIPERKFALSQPLFSGFKEFAAMSAARAERQQRTYDKVRAEQLLLADVADAFYLLREQRRDLQVLQAIRNALQERIRELRERERLGRSRASEVFSAEAQWRRVEAEMEVVRGRETTTRQLLEFLTGRDPLEITSEPESPLPLLGRLEAYRVKSDRRPDVQAAAESWQGYEKLVAYEKAGHWPTVGLEGNYYTERAGVLENVKWDAQLKAELPLYQGGKTKGAVREASARAHQARLRYEQAKRTADLEIRNAYADLQAAQSRLAALEIAVEAAEKSYEAQVQDYRRSLVSLLDVLQSLQSLEDVRRDYQRANLEARRLTWHLRVATGETLVAERK